MVTASFSNFSFGGETRIDNPCTEAFISLLTAVVALQGKMGVTFKGKKIASFWSKFFVLEEPHFGVIP